MDIDILKNAGWLLLWSVAFATAHIYFYPAGVKRAVSVLPALVFGIRAGESMGFSRSTPVVHRYALHSIRTTMVC